MYRFRRNPPTVQQIYDVVLATLANSDLEAYDEFQGNATFYKQVIKEALEAKYGKLKPARKLTGLSKALDEAGYTHKSVSTDQKTGIHAIYDSTGREVFRGRARNVWDWLKTIQPRTTVTTQRKKTSGTIELEIKTKEGKSYGMVTLPKSALELYDFASDDEARYGLAHVQWMPVYSDKVAVAADTPTGKDRDFTSMFVATDGHKLGVIVADRKPPSDVKALMFTRENWKKAFKSRVLLAEFPETLQEFPDFVQVIPNLKDAKGVYEFTTEAVDSFLAAKPRIKTGYAGRSSSYFALKGSSVTYRYEPPNLGNNPALFLTFPFKSVEGVAVVNPIKQAVYNAAFVHSAFALCPSPLATLHVIGDLSPAVLQGQRGAFAILMPIRYEGESVEAKPIVPFDTRQIPVWDNTTHLLEDKPPKSTAIYNAVRKGLKVGKEGSLFIAPVHVGQGPSVEHWVMYGYPGSYINGCVRLKGELDPFQNTQYPITIEEDEFKGWLQMNWPTVQGVGGESYKDALSEAKSLVDTLNKQPFEDLAFPPLRGMDKIVSQDENRYGLTHVGINEDGNLVASNGHNGLFIRGPVRTRNIGIPGEIYTGEIVSVQETGYPTYASSGHMVLPCEEAYVPANIEVVIGGLSTPDQTIELTPTLIAQIMKIKKRMKGGYGVIRFGVETKIIYVEDITKTIKTYGEFGVVSKSKESFTKFVATLPMVKDFPVLSIPFALDDSEYIAIKVELLQDLLYAMTVEPRMMFLELRRNFSACSIESDEMTGVVMPMRLEENLPPE